MICAMNIFALIPVAIPVARTWVRSQRKRYRQAHDARRLTESEKRALGSFFSSATLNKAVITEVPSIPNSRFYALGVGVFIDCDIRAMVAADMNSLQNRLEIEAYAMQSRFHSGPNRGFSVEDEVVPGRAF
jgi:hypothetical protein